MILSIREQGYLLAISAISVKRADVFMVKGARDKAVLYAPLDPGIH